MSISVKLNRRGTHVLLTSKEEQTMFLGQFFAQLCLQCHDQSVTADFTAINVLLTLS